MTPAIFLGAYVVDIIIGDPRWFPHPVVVIGKLISFLEGKIRNSSTVDEKKGGVILWFTVVIPVYFIALGIVEGCLFITPLSGAIITVLLAFLTLATRSLYDESKVVIDALNRGNIEEARKSLSLIVGRNTENLDEKEEHIYFFHCVYRLDSKIIKIARPNSNKIYFFHLSPY